MDRVADIGAYFRTLAQKAGIDHPSLLTHDAGGTAYFRQIRLIDMMGLCDRTFAKHREERETIRRYIFEERRPTFIHSTRYFANRIGLDQFHEFDRDYVDLPVPANPWLRSDIHRVRREFAESIHRALAQ
jgi:hypothetical protein